MTSLPEPGRTSEAARFSRADDDRMDRSFASGECTQNHFSARHSRFADGNHKHAIKVCEVVMQIGNAQHSLPTAHFASEDLANINSRKRLLEDRAEHLLRGAGVLRVTWLRQLFHPMPAITPRMYAMLSITPGIGSSP